MGIKGVNAGTENKPAENRMCGEGGLGKGNE